MRSWLPRGCLTESFCSVWPRTVSNWITAGFYRENDSPMLERTRFRRSATFLEKPTAQQADDALANHALWNTMVMTAKVETLWRLGQQCFPELIKRFERLGLAIGTSEEARVLETIYQTMPRRNFSSDLLQRVPDQVAVTELTNALWSDWGRPERITEALRRIGRTPAFPLAALASPFAPIPNGKRHVVRA